MRDREKERRGLRFDVAVMCGLRPNCKARVILKELVKKGLLKSEEVKRLTYKQIRCGG